eukprot:1157345-Pelagomonas_calceolata.AAC.1
MARTPFRIPSYLFKDLDEEARRNVSSVSAKVQDKKYALSRRGSSIMDDHCIHFEVCELRRKYKKMLWPGSQHGLYSFLGELPRFD